MSLLRIIRNDFELLSPAGDFERLEMALCYGADAVYLAGREFGMRAAAANFDDESLRRAVSLAHRLGKKVYVTVNTLPREEELNRLYDAAWNELGKPPHDGGLGDSPSNRK